MESGIGIRLPVVLHLPVVQPVARLLVQASELVILLGTLVMFLGTIAMVGSTGLGTIAMVISI